MNRNCLAFPFDIPVDMGFELDSGFPQCPSNSSRQRGWRRNRGHPYQGRRRGVINKRPLWEELLLGPLESDTEDDDMIAEVLADDLDDLESEDEVSDVQVICLPLPATSLKSQGRTPSAPAVTKRKDRSENNKFEFSLKLEDVAPENLNIIVKDNVLTLVAKKEETSDDGTCTLAQVLTKRVDLPQNVIQKELKSTLNPDGLLRIEAPLKKPEPVKKQKEVRRSQDIPIQILVETEPNKPVAASEKEAPRKEVPIQVQVEQ